MKVVGGFLSAFLFVAPAKLVLSSAQNPRLVFAKDHSIFRSKSLCRIYLSKFIICSILKQKEGGRCREQSGFLDQDVFGEKVHGMLGVAAKTAELSQGGFCGQAFQDLTAAFYHPPVLTVFPRLAIPFTVGHTPDQNVFAKADLAGFRAVMGRVSPTRCVIFSVSPCSAQNCSKGSN